jgi:Carbohydrate binding domain
MPRPTVSQAAEQLYGILAPLAYDDKRLDWPLLKYSEALAGALQEVNDYIYGGRSGYYNEGNVLNGSFDDPLDYNVDHWWAYHSAHSTITRNTNVFYTSPASLQANVNATAADLGASQANVRVKPNTTYLLKARLKGLEGRSWHFIVNQYPLINAGGTGTNIIGPNFPGSPDWQENEFQFTTLPTTNYLYIYIVQTGTAAATFYIDNVELLTLFTSYNGYPAWAVVMDVDTAPFKALPWLAQFVGVTIPNQGPEETDIDYDARVRAYIKATPGFSRGSPDALIAAVQQTLTGAKTVYLRERYGGAYRMEVVTITSQIPDPAATLRAILSQKPAGIVLTHSVVAGQDFQILYETHTTFQDVYTGYATMQGVYLDLPGT